MIKRIETRIIIAIILSCTIMTILQGSVMLVNINKSLSQNMESLVLNIAESNKNLIEQRVSKVINITDDISTIVESIVDPEELHLKAKEYENIIDPIVKEIIYNNIEDVMGAYLILDPDKTDDVYGAYYEDVEVNNNLKKMEKYPKSRFNKAKNDPSWYYECIDLKDGKWFEPYVSKAGIEMTSFTKPIYKDDTFIAMLSIDINFKLFKEFVNSISLIDSGYVFILNENYDFIMHNTYTYEDNLSTVEDGKYQFIADKIKADDGSVISFNQNNEEKFLAYDKLSNGWILCAVVGKSSLIQSNREFIKLVLLIMVFGIILACLIAVLFGKRISSTIKYVTKSLNTLSELDLTISEKDEIYEKKHSKNDQLGVMISSASNLRNHLRNIIPEIQNNSKSTLEYSDKLDKSIKQSSDSMNDVKDVMNELNLSSQKQIDNAKQGVEKLSVLADMIESSIAATNEVKSHLEKTQNANKINIENMNDLSNKFGISRENSKQISDNIKLLAEKTKNIKSVIVTIESIAKRTTLLSLNASIEASAAGEAGAGFAVVASEIGKLADQTKEGTRQIQDIVEEISDNMEITENSMMLGDEALSQADNAMSKSKQSFDSIDKDIDSMADVASELITTIERINQNKEEVIAAINYILSISEQTAASVEVSIKDVENERININNLADASEELKSISNILDSIVNSFKIK